MKSQLSLRFSTLVDALRAWADTAPERAAVVYLSDGERETARLSYRELDREARRVAASLLRVVEPGDRALLCFPPGADFVVAFLGCLYARVIAVPVYPPRSVRHLGRLGAIVADAEARVALTNAGTVRGFQGSGALPVPLLIVEPIGSGEPAPWRAPAVSGSDVAFLQYTSGSTSDPKGVVVAHANLAANITMFSEELGIDETSRCVSWLPVYHDMGLIGCLLAPLWQGATTVLMSPLAFVQKPVRWLRAITRYRATFTTAPNFGWELCTREIDEAALDALDLSSLKFACNGAEPVRAETLDAFSARFARAGFRREVFVPCYGLAEVTLYASGGHLGATSGIVIDKAGLERGAIVAAEPGDKASCVVSCGTSPIGQTLAIVDPEALRECPADQVGEIWVSGPHVARGYWNNPAVTEAMFHATLPTRPGLEFLRTGDLGFVRGGELFVVGRLKDLIIVLGRNHYPHDLEATVERSHAALRAGGAAAFSLVRDGSEGVGIAVEIAAEHRGGDLAAIGAAIVSAVWDEHEVRVSQLALIAPRSLPKTSSGKVRRRHTRELLLRDELNAVYRWPEGRPDEPAQVAPSVAAPVTHAPAPPAFAPPEGDVEQRVAEVWSEVLGRVRVGRADGFFALGGDSLRGARVVQALAARGIAGATLAGLFEAPVLAEFARGLRVAPIEQGGTAALVSDPAHRHEPFATTDVQQAYWLGRNAGFTLGGVGSHWYGEYDGVGVDLARLEAAWNAVVARHDMLRAVLDGADVQRVLPEVPAYRIAVADVAADELEQAHAALRDGMSHQVLELATWPLFDIRAVRCGDRTRVAFSFDYIVVDALSIMIVLGELSALYADPRAALAPVEVAFRDCVAALRGDAAATAAAEQYWSERIDRLPPPPQLPLRIDPALVQAPTFTRRRRDVPRAVWSAVVARGRARNLTPSSLLATAFAEVLAAWSGRDHLTINLTRFDRPGLHPDIDRVVGEFTSLLLVAYEPEPGETWTERAQRLQRQMARDVEHGAVSAVWVLREMARRGGGSEVAMPVVFTSTLGVLDDRLALSTAFGDHGWGVSQTPQVWLDHQVAEHDGGLLVQWDVVEALFPDGVIDAMFGSYLGILERLAASDAGWDARLPPLLPTAQRTLRDAVNDTRGPLPLGGLAAAVFARASEAPGRLAIAWSTDGDDAEMSHGVLSEAARCVASLLLRAGVAPGELVAVTLPRGPAQIVAVLGVLAAGAAYVPVGVEQPAERRARIHASAGIRHVLTSEELRDSLAWPAGSSVLAVEHAGALAPLPAPVEVAPEQLAYVIYTSGSTGEPKGVMISHRAALNTVVDVTARYGIGSDDRVLAVSALDFDLSVFDVFGLLGAGGALVLIDDGDAREATRWRALVQRWGVTVWNSVPALLEMLVLAGDDAALASLRVVMVSGDWVGLDLPGRVVAQAPGSRFIALGGATEAAIWSNAFEVETVPAHWRSIPYGHPLRNQKFRVVGPRGDDCPAWVAGELWIGGAGVADGYRGNPEATVRQFVEHAGERWYRTGDLGRYWADGTLEILGRIDTQVKIRGHRIEVGEVEAALALDGDVDAAVVVPVRKGGRAVRLAAFVVIRAGRAGQIDEPRLRAGLAARVPAHAVPASYHLLDAVPLTANGKVDRAALVRRAEAASEQVLAEPPRGSLEEALAGVWREVLGVDRLGRSDNFVALGGDSMLATKVVVHVRTRLDIDMSLRELFAAPTIAALAAALADRHLEEEGRI